MTHEAPDPRYPWRGGPDWWGTLGWPAPPKFVPVNMQVPQFGVTIATLDKDGNLTVKVDQPEPETVSS